MTTESIKEEIKRELPAILRADPEFRAYILEITRQSYADRTETQDRFWEAIEQMNRDRAEQARKWDANQAELQRMREEANQKWEEQNQKWEEHNRKWEEHNQKWDANQAELQRMREEANQKAQAQNQKWDANQAELQRMREEADQKAQAQNQKWDANQAELQRMREEANRKWEEQNQKWEEQNQKWYANQAEFERKREDDNRKWDENQAELGKLHEENMAYARKYDRSIGALGARWGLQSERAFRDALAGILEENFGVEVLHINDFDDTGEVFGRPEQVELDLIIKNGLLLICELKSSIDKAGMYSFERKARYYERRHQRQANRLIVISPMIDARAQKVADQLGIETFGDSVDVKSL